MKKLTIQLRGAFEDGEHVRLFDFVQELEAVREALDEIDSQFFGHGHPTTDYRVVDLRHNSPAAVILEPFPLDPQKNNAAAVVDRLLNTIRNINEGSVPADIDSVTLEKIGKIAKPYKRRVQEVLITCDNEQVRVPKTFEASIVKIIGEDQIFDGSFDGMLEMINFHGGVNRFNIYPTVGPARLNCRFSDELLKPAIEAVGKYVRVTGKIKQKQRDRFPYGIDAAQVETLPTEVDLPSFKDIRGIAPNLTGGMTSEDFVRSLRNA